jgi:hypothetical protein
MKLNLLRALVFAVAGLAVSGLAVAQAKSTSTDVPAKKVASTPRPKLARSAAKAVEEVTPIDDDRNVTLDEADLAVAKKVYVGHIACEFGAAVQITPAKREGFFIVQVKNARYIMHPVESRTGAVRLEDPVRGAMWLQLGNKSMLMSQKLGLRLADECMSTEQTTVADQMKKNPPRSLLEPLDEPMKAAQAPASAASSETR